MAKSEKYNWSERKILIVEDEESNFVLVEAYLSKGKPMIYHCDNGKDAIEYCRTNKDIDLILMDINMPELNGYEAASIIRGIIPDVPIIALTAYALDGDREKSINAGCSEYLSKPLDQYVFLETVNRFLN